MPYQWHFPPWRRIAMQGIMWVLLGGTVGLAALLDGHLRLASIVTLGDPVVDGVITFKLPDNWDVQTEVNPSFVLNQWTATKPNDPDEQRVVKIVHQKINRAIFPQDYIQRLIGPENQINGVFSRAIDGHPGLEEHWESLGTSDGQQVESSGLVYCVIVPSRGGPSDALTIEFERSGPLERPDLHVVNQIVDAIKITPPN